LKKHCKLNPQKKRVDIVTRGAISAKHREARFA
jgi:hypothetical protein